MILLSKLWIVILGIYRVIKGQNSGLKLKAKFKFLCNSYQACPEVKQVLKDLGFTDFKDLDNSPSFDILAKFELDGVEKIAKEIFAQCREKVQTIQITT